MTVYWQVATIENAGEEGWYVASEEPLPFVGVFQSSGYGQTPSEAIQNLKDKQHRYSLTPEMVV